MCTGAAALPASSRRVAWNEIEAVLTLVNKVIGLSGVHRRFSSFPNHRWLGVGEYLWQMFSHMQKRIVGCRVERIQGAQGVGVEGGKEAGVG